MRTPNTKCIICGKPLYRRPNELIKFNFSCCKGCRGEAYKKYPNKESIKNLELGREKGTNHLKGIPKSETHKKNIKNIMIKWCKDNYDSVIERGKKMRGENHYKLDNRKYNDNNTRKTL